MAGAAEQQTADGARAGNQVDLGDLDQAAQAGLEHPVDLGDTDR